MDINFFQVSKIPTNSKLAQFSKALAYVKSWIREVYFYIKNLSLSLSGSISHFLSLSLP